jgi:hypothetical protein
MALAAFKLGEMCYGNRDSGIFNTPQIMLTVIHLASIADAVNTAKAKKQALNSGAGDGI